ncbi:hypothetical protein Tco_1208146 [Tanacetum coccineum]
MSARIAKAAALSPSSFRKRYRSSYKTSSSSSLTLPVRKRYRGTSELILDTDSEGDELGEEDIEEDEEDENSNADDEIESHGLDDKGHGLGDEDHGLDDETVSEPLGLGYGAAMRRALESIKEIAPSTYEVGRSSRSVPEQEGLELYESILHDHTQRLDVLSPTLFVDIDRDVRELYTRSGAVRVEIFSQRYRFRSLEREQERATVTFRALWRLGRGAVRSFMRAFSTDHHSSVFVCALPPTLLVLILARDVRELY